MPLEDLTGTKYIDDLNENWPLGSDYPSAGDDHIRGIKNVLKKTFPNLDGPVTLTQSELNLGSIPSGTRMLFYQAAAPTGWSRVAGLTNTKALRVVASTDAGGGSGGSDDPILNNKVPSHTHTFSATTGNESANHTHSGTTNSGGSHNHDSGYNNGNIPTGALGGNAAYAGSTLYQTSTNGAHTHTFSTGTESVAHTHSVSGTTAANGSAANWTPRYLDVIVCEKD